MYCTGNLLRSGYRRIFFFGSPIICSMSSISAQPSLAALLVPGRETWYITCLQQLLRKALWNSQPTPSSLAGGYELWLGPGAPHHPQISTAGSTVANLLEGIRRHPQTSLHAKMSEAGCSSFRPRSWGCGSMAWARKNWQIGRISRDAQPLATAESDPAQRDRSRGIPQTFRGTNGTQKPRGWRPRTQLIARCLQLWS